MPSSRGTNIVKARDFNHFFGEAMERNRAAGDAVRRIHAERPFTNREDIREAFDRELQRLQPEFLAGELIELSKQVDLLLRTAHRRGFRNIDDRRTALAELAAEMAELSRATEWWLAEDAQTPLAFSLALIEKYRRVLVMLADSIKLPERAGDAPEDAAIGATVTAPAMK
jgi:hypothetical protein